MIRFKFQPSLKDYQALNRYALVHGIGRWLFIVGFFLLLYYFSYPLFFKLPGDMRSNGEIYRANAPLLFLPVTYLVMRFMVLLMTFRRFKAAKELRAEREYTFDETGLHVRAEAFSSDLNWSMFKTADSNGKYYFLKTGQNTYFYFPCSLVPDEKAFTDLVSGKVKVTKNWQKALAR